MHVRSRAGMDRVGRFHATPTGARPSTADEGFPPPRGLRCGARRIQASMNDVRGRLNCSLYWASTMQSRQPKRQPRATCRRATPYEANRHER